MKESLSVINNKEIMLVGLSRSGNHAILNWIWQQSSGRKLLLNCAEGKTNPFHTCRPIGPGEAPWRADGGVDPRHEAAHGPMPKDLLIHSYEDSFLGHVFSTEWRRHGDSWVGASRQRRRVVVLRDPFNLLASRRAGAVGLPPRTALRVWKQHARAFLGDTPHGRGDDFVAISYNRWTADRAYRCAIAETLGLAFTDAGRDAVSGCHGGSSFDGIGYDGRASAMPVTERWRRAIDDPAYRAVFDADTLALAERIFGVLAAATALERPRMAAPPRRGVA